MKIEVKGVLKLSYYICESGISGKFIFRIFLMDNFVMDCLKQEFIFLLKYASMDGLDLCAIILLLK
jgi:hypothetical protein